MCILFIYADSKPKPGGYKLILASNRDEFYARPAAVVSPWKLNSPLQLHAFGGVDLQSGREGGTWLAISGNNNIIKVGVLLNIVGEEKKDNVLGRGHIISDYITKNKSNYEYSEELINNSTKYNSFNLVSAEIYDNNVNILHCSNAPTSSLRWNEREAHGFGNSPPFIPFTKVQEGRKAFNKIIEEYETKEDLVKNCMNLLKSRTQFLPDNELLKREPTLGGNLSSIMVKVPEIGYGSRTHSVILIDSENNMDFYEETMGTEDPNDKWIWTHLQHQY